MVRNLERRGARPLKKAIAAVGLLAGLLAGCGNDPDAMVASAKQYIAGNDPKAASIQLKNALQEKPDHAEARFLLGQLSLQAGDFATAVKELERARNARYSDERVVPLLARALAEAGEGKKLLEQFSSVKLTDPAASAMLAAALGDAHLQAGSVAAAEKAFAEALAGDPKQEQSRIGMARIKAASKDLAGARVLLESVVTDYPKSAKAHALLATLLLLEGKAEAGVVSLQKAIEADPRQASHHFRLVSLLLRDGKVEEAKARLANMKKAVGAGNLYPVYLQGYVDFLEKRDKEAADNIGKVLGAAPDFLPARLLAGTIHMRLRDYNQARQHLGVVLSAQPQNLLARRMMASAHLMAHDAERALEVLEPALRKQPDDAVLLALAGQAHLAKGDFNRSSEFFAKAAAKNPNDPGTRMRLGVSRLGAGDAEQAFADLEKAANLDEHGIQADVALVMARLKQGKPEQALAAIAQLQKKQPDNPLTHNLRGGALLAKKDVAGARAAFEQAVKLDTSYLPAVVNLARLDLQDKRGGDAVKRLEALIAAKPGQADAYLSLADMLDKTRADKSAILGVLERGHKAAPDALSLKLALVRYHSGTGDHKQALAYAQQAQAAAPEDASVMNLLGAAQLAAGQAEQAVTTYGKLVGLQPDSPQALLLLARAQKAAGNPGGAELSLRKAFELKPEFIDGARALIALRLEQRDIKGASAVAAEVLKRSPKAPEGHLLTAEIALKQSNWPGAITALRSAQAIRPTAQNVVAMHAALSASGDAPGATREAEAWLRKNPKDLVLRGYLAEQDLRRKDFASAIKQYQAMVEAAPNNPLMLNNLAWASAQVKDPKALGYAQQALRLAPDSAPILDTLGMIRLGTGDKAGAIADLERAVQLAPKTVQISLNLARAYGASGDPGKAVALLERLEREHPDTKGLKEEIAAIRASL